MAQTGYFLQLTYKIDYGGIESFILEPQQNKPVGKAFAVVLQSDKI